MARVSPESSYILDHYVYETFVMNDLIYIIAEDHNLDVDKLMDLCNENDVHIVRAVDDIIENYCKKMNVYDRSKLFYRYLHRHKETLVALIRTLSDNYLEDHEIIESEEFQNYIHTFKTTFNKLKLGVNFSFNEIIETEYKRLQISNDKALKALEIQRWYNMRSIGGSSYGSEYENHVNYYYNSTGYNMIHSITTTNSGSYIDYNRSAASTYNSYTDGWESLIDMSHYRRLAHAQERRLAEITASNRNTNRNTYRTFLESTTSNQIVSEKRFLAKPHKDLTPEVRNRLRKSFKGLTRFLRKDEYEDLFNRNDLVVEGINWNFRIYFNSKKDIITYTKNMDNYSIPYKLELLTKSGERLCDICIVYPGCPILDEILSTLLLIKSGQEDVIIDNGNHLNKSVLYKNLIKDKNEFVITNDGLAHRANSYIRVKELVWDGLRTILNVDELSYIFDNDLTWEEIVGYPAFNLFDVKVFDSYVRKLNWAPAKIQSLPLKIG